MPDSRKRAGCGFHDGNEDNGVISPVTTMGVTVGDNNGQNNINKAYLFKTKMKKQPTS